MKKYCECFKAGHGCNNSCRCINCLNKKFLENNISNSQSKYTIDSTSIYVHNKEIIIETSQYNPNSKKFDTPTLEKKRSRINKTEESNKTNFMTPAFSTVPFKKTQKINVDDKLIKNLDKIY